MPPRTRAVRAPKASKENLEILAKTKVKITTKDTKTVRKPLADKTNSASDENTSPEPVKKVTKKSNKPPQKIVSLVTDKERPRRNRRLPPRYVENQVLCNLSNSKENATTPKKSGSNTPVKDASKVDSPFKTPTNVSDNSLIANRPKRVSRLPSKFDENSLSPYRFVPIQCHTSTPLVPKPQDKLKQVNKVLDSKQKLVSQQATSSNNSTQIKEVLPQEVTPQKSPPRKLTPQKISPKKVTSSKAPPYKSTSNKSKPNKNSPTKITPNKDAASKISPHKTTANKKKLVQKKLTEVVNNLDPNANERNKRVRRLRKPVEYKEDTLSPKLKSPKTGQPRPEGRKILKANSSFRVFEEKTSKNGDNQDVYEFTFDPSEEPPPQKKKRKQVAAKKPTKPKMRVYNNNYEKNIARAIADLKNVVTKPNLNEKVVSEASKPVPTNRGVLQPPTSRVPNSTNKKLLQPSTSKVPNSTNKELVQPAISRAPNSTTKEVVQPATSKVPDSTPVPSSVVISTVAEIHTDPAQNSSMRSNPLTKNHVSIRVEDIAADFDASIDHDINYSPVNSPDRIETGPDNYPNMTPERESRPDDPLNLRNDLSFFDDQPVANSSMNVSSRNPTATPWRAEFETLPIKWQADTYVKPDMTPALECSYINNFDDSKKKHVYTNMVAQTDDPLPEIEENEAPKLKQTSIISFIKEVVERSASKKKRSLSVTPTKANSLFDVSDGSSGKETSRSSNKDKRTENKVSETNKTLKRKHDSDNNPTPAKLPRKDNENTLFGFDDSENQDQENISPIKIVNNNRLRSLRSRSGAVLKELNKKAGPMRAELPAAIKSKLAPSSDAVEKIYDQMKSATDAPALLDKQAGGIESTNVADMPEGLEDNDSQSVHLFEDIELVHHLKPTRKSYGKAKKVTFQNSSDSMSEDEAPACNETSDSEDDLDDLSFHLPEVKTKRVKRKKKSKKLALSKKEKAEVNAWAACFNSMCEDIEEFDLVVE